MKFKKGDLIIVFILGLVATIWFTKNTIPKEASSRSAEIKIDGDIYSAFSLENGSDRREFPIELPKDNFIRIVMEEGQVWVAESSCEDDVCILTGKINKPGESIVCLPNKTIIQIKGVSTPDVDDIAA